MAFTATITAINRSNGQILVNVAYNDSVSGFNTNSVFNFPDDGTITIQSATTQITTVGTQYKNNLVANNTLQSKVGTVITI